MLSIERRGDGLLSRSLAFGAGRGLRIYLTSRETFETHEQFVAWKNAASETEQRAVMHWPGDTKCLADLNVFFVHTPVSRS